MRILCAGFAAVVFATAASAGCSRTTTGSACTDRPITIVASRQQMSAASVLEPLLYTDAFGHRVVVGRYDVFRILHHMRKGSPWRIHAADLLRPIFEKALRDHVLLNSKDIYPNFHGLDWKQTAVVSTAKGEVSEIFMFAIMDGSAYVESARGHQVSMTLEDYKASLPEGALSGVRAMVGMDKIYDVCEMVPNRSKPE